MVNCFRNNLDLSPCTLNVRPNWKLKNKFPIRYRAMNEFSITAYKDR